MSINFLAFYGISLHVWRNEFLNDNFHSDLLIFLESCFISYSEHLSVFYNNENYGFLPYIIFIAVQNSRITPG